MAQDDIKEVLRRPYRLASTKWSYRIRKLTRHRSVVGAANYEDYVEKQISDMAKKIAQSKPSQARPAKVKAATPVETPGENATSLFDRGRFDLFAEYVELIINGGERVSPLLAGNYVRACLKLGQPQRVVESVKLLSPSVTTSKLFVAPYLLALFSLRNIEAVKACAREMFALATYDKETLFRLLGEHRALKSPDLMKTTAYLIHREMGVGLSIAERVFLIDTLADVGGTDAALRLTDAKIRGNVNGLLLAFNIASRSGSFERSVEHFNSFLGKFGLSKVSAVDPSGSLDVNNLTATPDHRTEGDLVTVAMSTYNSSSTVIAALKSLSNQTYSNLEILVVDDCSSDDTAEKVRHYMESDARVRLIVQDANKGTYAARNVALTQAAGTYFTCNDSDDWSHPAKIELLVSALSANPDKIAVQSQLVRLSGPLGVKARRQGYIHGDASSTMYRKDQVFPSLGYYDEAPFGADNEFISRMKIMFGADCIKVVEKPLLIADWSPASLSGAAITGISDSGIVAPVRAAYQNAYRLRHARGEGLRREA